MKSFCYSCLLLKAMFMLYRIAFRADTKSYPVQQEHLSDMLLSTLGEIGMEQLRFVSEIALKSLFLYSGTSPLGHLCSRDTSSILGHKIWSRKNVHLLFVFVSSIEWTPLFRGKGHFLWVLKPRFNIH